MDPHQLAALVAKYPMRVLQNGNIRTSPVRLSYAGGLFKPRKVKDTDQPKYSVSLLFPVGAELGILYNAANQAAANKWGNNVPKNVKNPFLKQDDVPDDGYQDGAIYLRCNATENNPPQVRDLQGRALLTEADCYSGSWALATIRCFSYDVDRGLSRGVAFGIQNVLKIADGDRFSGKPSADEDFNDILEATGGTADMSNGAGQFFR